MGLELDPTKASQYPTRREVQHELDSLAAFPGFRSDVRYKNSGAVNLAATTGTHSIPGPDAGKLRVIFQTALTSLGSTPSITTTLNPSGFIFGRAQSPGVGTAA